MDLYKKKYYQISIKIYQLLILNILWVVFTILGLGIFGFFPATLAMFSVTRKWVTGEEEISIFKMFLETYKKEFIRSNIFGFVFGVFGYILLVSYKILTLKTTIGYMLATYIILFWMIVYLIIITYFFPLYVHYDTNWFNYIKWSFLLGILHPLNTFIVIAVIPLVLFIILKFVPALLIFFGASLPAYLINKSIAKLYPLY